MTLHRAAKAKAPRAASRSRIPAQPAGVQLANLENGLTVIVAEDRSAPVVSVQAWCRTGSIDEGRWLGAGLSHVLEHMLFKGTSNRPGHRIDQEIQEAGGYMNAYTAFDRTVYWINVPNTGARVAIDVLCDIMQHATLPPDELARELDVIRREMDMGQDDPHRRSGRRLFETAYTRSPYRFPIIGVLDIFNRLKPEDIRGYYEERYAPNNVFFIIVGDVKAAEVLEQIRTAYATTPARPLAPSVLPEEPRQMAAREVIEEATVELGHVHFSWHIPDLRHPDVPLLDLLATLLGAGRSSRLYQVVREKRGLVSAIDAWTYNPGNAGLFGISAVLEAARFSAARESILNELERVRKDGITSAELKKGVKQFIAATLSTRKTMQGQAQDLGSSWLAAGDLNFSERYLATVKRATIRDLRRVAREYLTAENRTCYALLPNGAKAGPTVGAITVLDHPIQKFELPNGLRFLVKEDHRLPFVQFRAVFRGGVLAETAENNGITQMMARTMLKGTRKRSAAQIATEIESVGGSIDSFGGNNSFGVSAEVLSEDFHTGLGLVRDVLLDPVFPAEAIAREREVQLANIKAQKDQLLQCAFRAMRRSLFGPAGYGLDALGDEESVTSITVAGIKAHHRALTLPSRAVLAIYGDVKAKPVLAAVRQAFQAWQSPAPIKRETEAVGAHRAPGRVGESRDKKQAVLVIGFPGTTIYHPDHFALELIQEACSDLGSRLFLRIREKLGLAYYVGAQHFAGLEPGYFALYCGTAPDQAERVEEELLKEAALLATEGLTEEELKRGKAKIVGQRKIARQDLGNLATATSLDELYGLGYANLDTEDAKYEAVTLTEIQAVAKKYFVPGRAAIAVFKP